MFCQVGCVCYNEASFRRVMSALVSTMFHELYKCIFITTCVVVNVFIHLVLNNVVIVYCYCCLLFI